MIPHRWVARIVGGIGAFMFVGATLPLIEGKSVNVTTQIIAVIVLVLAVLLGTGDITIGRDWK